MAEYICKCGKNFTKNTSAAVTGYRDTADCTGCPYLLVYGQYEWNGKAYECNVQGHECRATQRIIWNTGLRGDKTGKNALHILSLDFDFLERVNQWIKEQYPEGEISGSFSRKAIRSAEYESSGRYSYTIYCEQNKAAVAAKRELLHKFFSSDGFRLDISEAAEKAKILNDIERGKKKRMDYIISKRTSDGQKIPFGNSAAETGTAPDGRQDANAAETAPAGDWAPGGGAWDDSESMVDSEESEEEVCTQKSHKTEAPCSNAPSPKGQGSPADAGAAALSPCDAAPACSAAAFDYSGLDAQTVQDLQLAEREYKNGRKMAEIGLRRMADAVAIAHDALCGSCDNLSQLKHGNRGSDTFGAWCESVGLNRKAAERLLNVAELFANSSPNQQKLLQELSPSLLYAAAKPSAPEEAVDLVKSGDIKTHKEYQQLLAQLKQAEAERDDARREKSKLAADCNRLGLAADKARSDKRSLMEEINSRERKITELLNQSEAADQQAEKLRAELRQAKAALEGVNADSSVARERADRLAVELAESEAEIAQLKEQLAATPGVIDGHAIDTEELERRAEAMAKAKIEEENAKWTQMVEGLQKQVKQLQDGTDMPSKIGTAQALIDDILTGIEADLNWMPINQQKDLRIRCALDDLAQSLQEFADNFSKTDFGHGGEPDV